MTRQVEVDEISIAQNKWAEYFDGQVRETMTSKESTPTDLDGYVNAWEPADSRDIRAGKTGGSALQRAWGNPKAARKAALRYARRVGWHFTDIKIVHAGNYKYEPWVKQLS